MKLTKTIIWLSISIVVSLIILYILTAHRREGFTNPSVEYETLKKRLKTTLSSYCDLAVYVQTQMKVIYTSVGESESQAADRIKKTYADVYACKDEDASSRPSCSLGKIDTPEFISCDTYMKLPAWTNEGEAAAIALNAIPDDLADRISREIDWYSQVSVKLRKALDAGNNPPATVPDSENSPATNSSGKPWSLQGFLDYSVPIDNSWSVEGFDGTCTPSQINLKAKKAAETQAVAATEAATEAAASCTMPTPDTQIARVNKILDSEKLQTTLTKCTSLKTVMEKLKSDQQKAKEGRLYAWQQDGPTKTFATLPIGNRTDGLLSSLKQNQM